jgi:hypothetical protein
VNGPRTKRGTCRVCGCTETNACRPSPRAPDVTCAWTDDTHTLCTRCAGELSPRGLRSDGHDELARALAGTHEARRKRRGRR